MSGTFKSSRPKPRVQTTPPLGSAFINTLLIEVVSKTPLITKLSPSNKVIDPSGKAFPRYYYNRIARTETRRVVENSHLSGLKKLGFTQVQRLVTVDSVTDKDLCIPFENAVYPIDKSGGVIPAHPNCRCTFTPYEASDEINPREPVPESQILKPDVEGAEILDLE